VTGFACTTTGGGGGGLVSWPASAGAAPCDIAGPVHSAAQKANIMVL
jgi:hypothetical protein